MIDFKSYEQADSRQVNDRSLCCKMRMPNTEYQQEIAAFYRQHKRMPTYNEVRVLAGFRSKNSAYKLVRRLIEAGVVSKDEKGRLLPKRLMSVPVLGSIRAGFPSPADEELLDTITLD